MGMVCTKPFLLLEKALGGPVPSSGEKVRISIFLCKRNGTGTEQNSIREGFLEEVANVPFSYLLSFFLQV